MGNQLSTIPPDRFRDQIFSIVLYYISSKVNPNLKFVPREKCTTGDSLPIPEHPDLSQILNLYNINDELVINYVKKNILNSEENLIRFYQTLIQLLQEDKHETRNSSYKPESTPRHTDRLTRSQLNKIKSKNPSIASTYREKKERQLLQHEEPVQQHKPESEHPAGRFEDSSVRSSHFTPSRIINLPEQHQVKPKFPGNSEIPDESFDKVRQNLVVNLLSRNEPGYDQELSEEDRVPSKTKEVESEDSEEVKASVKKTVTKLSAEHQIEDEMGDDNTLKHRHRFKDQCIIQENFD